MFHLYTSIDPFIDGLSCATATSKCTAFTKMFNFTGLPAISTPMGYDKNNMPIGLQLASSWVIYRLFSSKQY